MNSISIQKQEASKALVLFCGLPGSGKTTLTTSLCALWNRDYPTAVIKGCSVDELSCHQNAQSFDPGVWKSARLQSRHFVQEALAKQNQRCLIYVDDTVFYRSMRKEFFRIATSSNSAFFLVYLQCSMELCLIRNSSRGAAAVPEWIMRKTAEQFEPPDETKCYWEANTIIIDSSQSDFHDLESCKKLADKLMTDWKVAQKRGLDEVERLQQKADGQRRNQESFTHRLDLVFRSIITQKMKKLKSENCKVELSIVARGFNQIRLDALQHFKSRLKWTQNAHEIEAEIQDVFVNNIDSVLERHLL
eukprot:g1206.t1